VIEFGVLGPLIVRRDYEPLALDASLLRRLLVLLLCRPGQPWSIASIVDVLWPAGPPATARKTLQVYVGRLRNALGDPKRIRHDPGGYSIVVAADELDSLRFRALVDAGRAAHQRGEPAAADGLLTDALRLWRGSPFANLDGADVIAEKSRQMEELWRAAHELRAAVRLDPRRHLEVVADLAGLLTNHPYQERLISYLMLALYRSDCQSEALDLYRRARNQLTEDLGIEPGPTLSWLQQAILRGDGRLWQLGAADLGGLNTQPSHPFGAIPAQLPPDVGGFTGRAKELASLDAVLAGIGAQPTALLSMMDTQRGVEYAQEALASHRKSGHLPGAARARRIAVTASSASTRSP
jgi:DNA-binding SARP family transcriptional activator